MAHRSHSAPPGFKRRGARRILLAIIGLLYIAAVPWYRAPGGELRLFWGLPDWVAVAIACYVAIAILNSLAWCLTDIEDPPGAGSDEERRP